MITIRVEASPNLDIDVDGLVSQVLVEFEASKVTAEDSYQSQREKLEATASELKREGRPIQNEKLFLSDIENRRIAFGKSKDITISHDGNEVMKGRIAARLIFLQSNREAPGEFQVRVMEFLRSLNIGRVVASWE